MVNSGDSVTLLFYVAVNSDGNQWSTSMVSFSFTTSQGEVIPVAFTADDSNFPQHYSLLIESAEGSLAGIYKAMAPGETIAFVTVKCVDILLL